MIKLLTILLLISTAYAQPFIGVIAGNTIGVKVGFLSDDLIVLNAAFDLPYSSQEKAKIFSINAGRQFGDVYNITPTIGGAYLKSKDFSEYDQGGQIKEIEKVKLIYGLEAGKDINNGRLFIESRYCDRFYYSAGVKFFL